MLLVRSDARIGSIRELQGRTVALTDPGSTSGALIPLTEFKRKAGLALSDHVGRLVYAGSHDRALAAVQSGKVDAAFVSSRRVDDFIGRGNIAAGDLRELWRSRPIHYDPFTLSSHLCADVQARISKTLIMPSPARDQLLQAKGAMGMRPVKDADYRWLEELVRQLGQG